MMKRLRAWIASVAAAIMALFGLSFAMPQPALADITLNATTWYNSYSVGWNTFGPGTLLYTGSGGKNFAFSFGQPLRPNTKYTFKWTPNGSALTSMDVGFIMTSGLPVNPQDASNQPLPPLSNDVVMNLPNAVDTFTLTTPSTGTAYYLGVNTTSSSSGSVELTSLTATYASPDAVTGLAASNITGNGLDLNWNPDTTGTDPASTYNVYQNGTLIKSGITGTSYQVTGLAINTSYSFEVAGVDENGAIGPYSPTISATTQDPPPTAAPTNLKATNITDNGATITWDSVTNAMSYKVYVNGNEVGTTNSTTYSLTGLKPVTGYKIQVIASDLGGDGPAATMNFTTAQIPPAPQPTNVNVSGTTGGTGTVTWTPPANAPSGTTYTVYNNGQPVGTTTGTSMTVSPYDPNAIYTVGASAPGYTTPPPIQAAGAGSVGPINSGFSATDLFTNAVAIISSFGSIILLVLVFLFWPRIKRFWNHLLKKEGRDKQAGRDSVVSGRVTSTPTTAATVKERISPISPWARITRGRKERDKPLLMRERGNRDKKLSYSSLGTVIRPATTDKPITYNGGHSVSTSVNSPATTNSTRGIKDYDYDI